MEFLFNFTQVDGYADNLQGNAYDAVFIDVYPENGDRGQAKTIELNIYGLYDSTLELYSDKPRVVVSEENSALSREKIIEDYISSLMDEGIATDSFTEWRKMSISYENIEGEHESKQYFIQPFEDSKYFLAETYSSIENREDPIYVFDYYVEISSEEEIQQSIEEIKSLVN